MAPTTYADVLARNIRAARSRADLNQELVAARMRNLGHTAWLRQTVANVEKARRRVTAEEVLALAWALQTSISALMMPTDDDIVVDFPSGGMIAVAAVRRSVEGRNDGSVRWDGDVPLFDPEPVLTQLNAAGNLSRARVSGGTGTVTRQDPGTGQWLEDRAQPIVAAIVTSDRGVLIGRRNDGKPPWTFIAGEQDAVKDENPADTAIREVKEETGLLVRAGELIGERVHPKTGRRMIYIAAAPTHGTDVFVGDEDELAEVRWVGLAEADELLPGMFEPAREHLERELGGTA